MPNIGNHVDAIFLPESVNTSTTLRINGGDLHLDDDKKILLGQTDDLQIYHSGSHSYIDDAGVGNLYIRSGTLPIQNLAGTKTSAIFNSGGEQELRYNNEIKFVTTNVGIDVTGNNIRLLGPTSGSTYTTSILTLRGFRQSNGGEFGNIDFKNIDANSSNTEYVGARISAQATNHDGGSIKFFVTPTSSTTLATTPALTLSDDSNAEFAGNVNLPDDRALILGTDSDIQIVHESNLSKSVIKRTTTGDFYIQGASGSWIHIEALPGESSIKAAANGTVELYYDNSKRIETTNAGVSVTGALTVSGDLTVNGTTTTINSTTLTVDDKNIVLASGAANSAAADGAGITIDGANESLTWVDSNKSFKLSTRLAIGNATSASANLRLAKDVGGESATTYYAFLNNGNVQPDVTGTAYYSLVQVRTDGNNGTGYTISNLEGYSASVGNGTVHADTTITNLIGFNVKNTWIEGTKNYGYRGQIPSGTNRWNVYMDGSASNYFEGNVGIGTSNPDAKLVISEPIGSTTPAKMRFVNEGDRGVTVGFDDHNASPNFSIFNGDQTVEFVSIDASGDVGIGTVSPQTKLDIRQTTQFDISNATASAGILVRGGSTAGQDSYGGAITLGKISSSRPGGSIAAVQTTSDPDQMGIAFLTHGSTTTNNTVGERVRIDAGGNVIIGGTTPATVAQTQLTLRSNSQVGLALLCGAIQNSTIYMGGLADGYSSGDSGYSDGAIQYNNSSNHMQFDTAGTERLRITSAGDAQLKTANARLEWQAAIGGTNPFIRSIGTDQEALEFNTGGTERIRISSGGNVGIGTNNPTDKLHVFGDNTTGISIAGYQNGVGKILGNHNHTVILKEAFTIRPDTGRGIALEVSGNDPTDGLYVLTDPSEGGVADTIAFQIVNNLTSTFFGNVLIRSASEPALLTVETDAVSGKDAKLSIRGARTSCDTCDIGLIEFDNKTTSAYTMARISARDPNGSHASQDGILVFSTGDAGTVSDAMVIDEGGRVGIGNTNPLSLLHAERSNTTSYPFAAEQSGTYAYTPYDHEVLIRNTADGVTNGFCGIAFNPGSDSPNDDKHAFARVTAIDSGSYRADISFGTRNTNFKERVRIKYDGTVGIGTTNPLGTLHIESTAPVFKITDSNAAANAKHWDIKANTTNMLRIQAINDDGSSGGGNLFDFQRSGNAVNDFLGMSGGTYWFTINNNNQNVGIGTTTPDRDLHVNGTTRLDGIVQIGDGTTSSYQLNIEALDSGNNDNTLHGVRLDVNGWKNNQSTKYGFLLDIDTTATDDILSNRSKYGLYIPYNTYVAENAGANDALAGTFNQNFYGQYTLVTLDDNPVSTYNAGKANQVYGARNRVRMDHGGGAIDVRGTYSQVQVANDFNSTSNTIDKAYAAYNFVVNDSDTTTFTEAYGTYSWVNQDNNGTMTDAYGVYSRVDRDGGTGTNAYCFRGAIEGTWGGKKYGVYLSGADENYFSGNVGIGSSEPTTTLELNHASEPTMSLWTGATKRAAFQAQSTGAYIYSYDDKPMFFSAGTGNSFDEQMRIEGPSGMFGGPYLSAVYFLNTEGSGSYYRTNPATANTGVLAFDENFYTDADYGSDAYAPAQVFGSNGGGLVIKNEDGWGGILTSQNARFAHPTFEGIGIGQTRSGSRNVLDLGSGTMNRGISWGGTSNNYCNIWAEYSSGDLYLGSGVRPTGTNTGFVSSYGGSSIGRSAIELQMNNGNINFYNATANTVSDGNAVSTSLNMVIKGDGNVGIGTNNPSEKLHVHGASTFGGTTDPGRAASINTNGQGFFRYDDNNLTNPLTIENRATNATTGHGAAIRFRFGDSASNSAHNAGRISFVQSTNWTSSTSTNDAKFIVSVAQNGSLQDRLVIEQNGTVVMADSEIDPGNHIEVGKGSGSVAMTINDGRGNANITFNHTSGVPDNTAASQSAARIETSVDSNNATMNFELGDSTSNGVSVGLSNVLHLDIGLVSVTGDLDVSGTLSQNTSDGRLKENLVRIPTPLDKIDQLHGYTFDWKAECADLGFTPKLQTNDIGLIAQDVQAVMPQAVAPAPFDHVLSEDGTEDVSITGENYLTVQYERLVPLLVEAIKELRQEVETLKAQISGS